ncbi:conserved hypothetical protein [Thiomonas sp. X19]|uniref:hypothetical protein n=1 Tax=Thiomonas sp. X19 TaxID=1050370 RepID=UPI000B69DD59|nr:hypothetical protein [Thiomonas sp. X19]SCC93764.1 conserved hypothetical protein [Thiomonas sp. X19]
METEIVYFAQAFHRGEPEQRSYVIAVGTLDVVNRLALAEQHKHPEYGVAVYKTVVDQPTTTHAHLVQYYSSESGEHWTDHHSRGLKHGLLE